MTIIAYIAGTVLGCAILYAACWLVSKIVRLVMGIFAFCLAGLLALNAAQAIIHGAARVISGMAADIQLESAGIASQAQEAIRTMIEALF